MTTARRIYRHRLSTKLSAVLSDFAMLHAYEDRKEYKKHWDEWLLANDNIVQVEVRKLRDEGFVGDPTDKMYKAGRYYFRKKSMKKRLPAKMRRVYVGTSRDMLGAMDEAIVRVLDSREARSPAETYDLFVAGATSGDAVRTELLRLCDPHGPSMTHEEAEEKLKKTFKNRYYKMISAREAQHKTPVRNLVVVSSDSSA